MSASQINMAILNRTDKDNLCNQSNPFTSAIQTIYPNPVKGKLTVEYILAKGANTLMSIYDINGKLCLQKHLKTNVGIKSINVEQLTSGVYILKLDSKSQEFIVK